MPAQNSLKEQLIKMSAVKQPGFNSHVCSIKLTAGLLVSQSPPLFLEKKKKKKLYIPPDVFTFLLHFSFHTHTHTHTHTHLNPCDLTHKPSSRLHTHIQNLLWPVVPYWAGISSQRPTRRWQLTPNIWHCVRHRLHTWLHLVFSVIPKDPRLYSFKFFTL